MAFVPSLAEDGGAETAAKSFCDRLIFCHLEILSAAMLMGQDVGNCHQQVIIWCESFSPRSLPQYRLPRKVDLESLYDEMRAIRRIIAGCLDEWQNQAGAVFVRCGPLGIHQGAII